MLAFERAIAIDPAFALAYAELALKHMFGNYFFLLRRKAVARKGIRVPS